MQFDLVVQFWQPFYTGLLVALLTTPLAIYLAWKYQVVDDPRQHQHEKVVHTYPTPRLGGISVWLAVILVTLVWLPWDKHLWAIWTSSLLAVVVGVIDDKFDISPYVRLLTNLLSAVILVAVGIRIDYLSHPLGQGVINLTGWQWQIPWGAGSMVLPWLAVLVTLLWIVGMMNLVGMGAGGIEGQFPGVVVIAALFIAGYSLKFSADIAQWPVITLAAGVAGAYLGLLVYNFYPQKIIPGYSAKSLAGLWLAILAILATTKVGLLMVILGVPLVDFAWAIVRRVLSGRSPFWGDRGHLHHRLLDSGWSKVQIVLFYWIISFFLGWLALSAGTQQKILMLMVLALLVGSVLRLKHKP